MAYPLLAHVAVCQQHHCRLHDRCWRCDKQVSPLALRVVDTISRCHSCDAILAEAVPHTSEATQRQVALQALLRYVALYIPPHKRAVHLEALQRRFHNTVAGWAIEREAIVASLVPDTLQLWFGVPVDARHTANLYLLAEGGEATGLPAKAGGRIRRSRRSQTLPLVAGAADLEPNDGHKRRLPHYVKSGRDFVRTMIEDCSAPIQADASHRDDQVDRSHQKHRV